MGRSSTYSPEIQPVEYEAPEALPEFESVDVNFIDSALDDDERSVFTPVELYDPEGPKGFEDEPPAGPGMTEEEVQGISGNVANNTASIDDHEERISALEDPV